MPFFCSWMPSLCGMTFDTEREWWEHERICFMRPTEPLWLCSARWEGPAGVLNQCRVAFRRESQLQTHLESFHGLPPNHRGANAIRSESEIFAAGSRRYWCGFCCEVLCDSNKPRAQHLRDHFCGLNDANQRSHREQWIDFILI